MLYGTKDEPGEEYDRLIFDAMERSATGNVNTCGVYIIRYGRFQDEVIYKIGMSRDLGQRLPQYANRKNLTGNAAYLFCESEAHALACERTLKSIMTDNPSSRKWKGREYFAIKKDCIYKGHELAERLFSAMAVSRTFNDAEFVAHCLIHHHPHTSIWHTGRDLHWLSYAEGCKGENFSKDVWIEFGMNDIKRRINYHNDESGLIPPETILTGYCHLIDYLLEKKIWYEIDGLIYHWVHAKDKQVSISVPEYDIIRYSFMRRKNHEKTGIFGGSLWNPEPIVSECCPYYLHYGLEIHRASYMQNLNGGKHISEYFKSLNEVGIFPQLNRN